MEFPLDIILWRVRDICALREELPQEPIGVLVGPAFPWMVRSGEIEWARICLSMATDGAFFCTGRALLDEMRDDELPTTLFCSLLVTALPMMTQSPEDELRRCPCWIQQASTHCAVNRRDADDAAAML